MRLVFLVPLVVALCISAFGRPATGAEDQRPRRLRSVGVHGRRGLRVRLTWGPSPSRGFVAAGLGSVRHCPFGPFQARSIRRHLLLAAKWRARDAGQGCAAPAKPAGAKRMSLTRLSPSRRKCRRQRTTSRSIGSFKPELVQLRDPWSEPDCVTGLFQSRFKLTYGRRSKRPHPYPACAAAVAQENETLLELGV